MRITLLAGHYGSGKTNFAVNYALKLAEEGKKLMIADLDIVNPYFRTKDSAEELARAGILLISSPYAGSNVDVPALPQELYALCDNRDRYAVVDVGGDDRGALALGRIVPSIQEENNYDMLLVVNFCRPLSRTPADVLAIKEEIESACRLPFTALINNTNLGSETTPQTVLDSISKMEELSQLTRLPVRYTSACEPVARQLYGKLPNLFPLKLQKKGF